MAKTLDELRALAVTSAPSPGQGLALDPAGNLPLAVRKLLPGYQFDYEELNGLVSVVSSTRGSPTTVVAGNAVIYDGVTRIQVDCFFPIIRTAAVSDAALNFVLLDGSNDFGRIASFEQQAPDLTNNPTFAARFSTFFSPPAGKHTYTVAAYQSGGNGTVGGGVGGAGTVNSPGFLRITRA